MNRFALLAIFSLTCAAAAQDKPVPAAEAPGKMTLPEGFKATLFAGEPDVVQPIAFTFDDRGRVWVVECLSYPNWSRDGKGKDRVTMYEDRDGDGKFDRKRVVISDGSNLSGIELGHGGIWLCSPPNLVFYPCNFNSDAPAIEGPSEIVLDGWNIKDTKHNIFNSLIWGPDGWLYGCNGIQSKSFVAKPGTPAKDRTEFNCGVWRYHPTSKIFEPFAHGTTNPFGLDYDEYGELFMTNCVIKHLFHVVPGGHFDRMYGQDVNQHSYGLMHSVADYIHWAGGDWTSSRGNKPEHSDAGGGHAHSGAVIYLGDNFPKEYYNSLLTCNIHGNRLNRDVLKRSGSGYKSERAKDFLFANDAWFRGIATHAGPDGGLYVSDWCDTGECHNYDKVDATNGRIHKVVFGTPKPWFGNLAELKDVDLIKLQTHANDWFARHARRLLHERSEARNVDPRFHKFLQPRKLDPNTPEHLKEALKNVADMTHRLRFAWALEQIGDPAGAQALLAFENPDPLKAWGIRLLMERYADAVNSGKDKAVAGIEKSFRLHSPTERLALASGLRRVDPAKRELMLYELLKSIEPKDATDQNLPLMTWYALEPCIGNDQALTSALLRAIKIPLVWEYAARKLTAINRKWIGNILLYAVGSEDPQIQRAILHGVEDGLGGVREMPPPGGWRDSRFSLLTNRDGEVRERAMSLAVVFGDERAIADMKATATDPKADAGSRSTALRVLLRRGKPDLLPILQQLIDDKAMRPEAIRGLAAFNDAGTPARLLKLYPTLTDAEKEDAVQTLAARTDWALALLDAVEANTVPRKDLSVFVARQMQGLKDKRVGDRLAKVWGTLQPASAQRAALTTKYKALLKDDVLAKADLSKGRQVYAKNCVACHKLYDDGGDVGPALTGAQRSSLDYILENVLDPSAVVPREYQVTVIDLNNGRRINGIVRAETEKAVTIRTANETLVLPKDEIENRTASKLSMMPEGLFDKLSEQEVRDLVAYLRGRGQVPLPKETGGR